MKLPSSLNEFIQREVKAGRFKNANEAICDSIRLLEQRDHVARSLRLDFRRSAMMESMKAINATKSAQRDLISKIGYDIAENAGQRNGKPPLKFAPHGIGREATYHRMPIPHPDPKSPGGLRRVPTDMHKRRIKDVCVLRAIRDELTNDLDSMGEMGEMQSLRLQMAMDRRSKAMSTLSNILKKISDTQSSIVSNIK